MDPDFVEAMLTGAGLDVVVSAPLGREEMAAVIDEGVAHRHDGFIVVGLDVSRLVASAGRWLRIVCQRKRRARRACRVME